MSVTDAGVADLSAASLAPAALPRFDGDLCIKQLLGPGGAPIPTADGRAQWLAVAPALVFVDVDGERITNPVGEPTDLGSIPQLAWSLGFSPDGVGARAFSVHDLLYRTRGTCEVAGVAYRTRVRPYSRADADRILRDGLRLCGVGQLRRYLIWAAVRVGGSSGWGD